LITNINNIDRYIDKIIIHCTATPEGRDVSIDTIREWHLDRGWSDIGYHYVIDIKGVSKEGRDLEVQGAHTKGYNKNSIGIAYVGGVEKHRKDGKWITKDTRTENQKDRLEALILDLMDRFPNATLHGHNEFSTKDCPSFDVQEEYKEIIDYFR
jgi:N-acetylmuramoyl-L-alanine amidase